MKNRTRRRNNCANNLWLGSNFKSCDMSYFNFCFEFFLLHNKLIKEVDLRHSH